MSAALELISNQSADAVVDVVFVHGLSGDGRGTWQAQDPPDTWMDWLADDHPEWAVWTLDYTDEPG